MLSATTRLSEAATAARLALSFANLTEAHLGVPVDCGERLFDIVDSGRQELLAQLLQVHGQGGQREGDGSVESVMDQHLSRHDVTRRRIVIDLLTDGAACGWPSCCWRTTSQARKA